MGPVRLTDAVIRRTKSSGERVELWDTVVPGLHLRVSFDGRRRQQGRVWYFRYRFGGHQRRLKIGVYSAVSAFGRDFNAGVIEPGGGPLTLTEARAVAGIQRGHVASQRDPQAEKRAKRRAVAQARAFTVAALSVDFLRDQKRQGVKSWPEQARQLDKDVLPVLGDLPASEVESKQVRDVVNRILRRGKRRKSLSKGGAIQANRTRSLLVQLFNFALRDPSWRDQLDHNPAQATPKPLKAEPPRERELTDEELGRLWNAAEDLEPVIRGAFRFRLLTGQRWEEIRSMQWAELRSERIGTRREEVLVWRLPPSRTKAKREHLLPLPDQAREILEGLRPLTGESRFVFESPRRPGSPISRVNRSFRRWKDNAEVEDFLGLDVRRAVATGMARLRTAGEVIESVLNHAPRGITRRVYNRYNLLPEKLRALKKWANHLEVTLSDEKPSKVVRIR